MREQFEKWAESEPALKAICGSCFEMWRRTFYTIAGLAIALLLSGCVHVRHYFAPDFPQKDYERCAKKHSPESCKPQVWRCKPDGTECEEEE